MQNSVSNIIQRYKVLALYKSLFKYLRVNKCAPILASLSTETQQQIVKSEPYLELLRNEFRQNTVSDSKYCMQKDEMYFLGNAYLSYLESTRDTLALYAKYCRGERSIEEAANIVGLRLPQQYQGPTTANK
jgi:hypothetical protein